MGLSMQVDYIKSTERRFKKLQYLIHNAVTSKYQKKSSKHAPVLINLVLHLIDTIS